MSEPQAHAGRALNELISQQLMTWLSLSLIALNLLMGWFVHRQLHHQTDAILLTLAATEAGALEQHSAGRGHGESSPHVHPTTVVSPWGGSEQVTKYAFVLDERCELLDGTAGLAPTHQVLCDEAPRAFFMSALLSNGTPLELRAASAQVSGSRGSLTFVVGVEHSPLDTSLWETVLLNVLASGLVALIGWWSASRVARRLTTDLARLEEACEGLALDQPTAIEQLSDLEAIMSVPLNARAGTPRELVTLAKTFGALGERLAESLSAQRRVIAEAAHELRTPITALKGELEVTLRRERSVEELTESLYALKQDVERLRRLSERLLDSASAHEAPLTLKRLPLVELIREGVLSPLKVEGATLTIHCDERAFERCWVQADRDASVRALSNITRNVLTHAQASALSLQIQVGEGTVELSVQDNGVGLAPSLKTTLFQPFSRVSARSGYGLGLSIAYTLMRRQGGALSISPSSFEGQGVGVRLQWSAVL